jgi:hypothetical protein
VTNLKRLARAVLTCVVCNSTPCVASRARMQALDSAPAQVSALHCSEPRVAAVVGDVGGELKYGDLLVCEDSITW